MVSEVGWTQENSRDGTKGVGTKQANELGIYDMSGNVEEWCEDVAYSSFTSTSLRRVRGGSIAGGAIDAAVDAAVDAPSYLSINPGVGYGSLGFRVARSSGN
jgi:formylglycine-generating enzyme required for sulfatase activity